MEELQNLRFDSELLENLIEPKFINFIKLITKLTIASISFVHFFYERSCGQQINNVIEGSCITLYIESFIFISFEIIACYSRKCKKCKKIAQESIVIKIIIDIAFDLFYFGWGIYITVIYFNENNCYQKMSITSVIALSDVIYFLFTLSFMFC